MSSIEQLYHLFLAHPSISTDSRRVAPGSLFFALRGDNFNGNRFAADALKTGAAAAVVDDKSVIQPTNSGQYILVDDVLKTLQLLAAHHRRKLGIPILTITGSNGKTTTKELLGRVLSTKFRTGVTSGNLNNHIGVPLTLLAMDANAEFGVVEMGASHIGEIAELCRIAQPDYGLITNIGLAHLEGFGSPEGVRRGKGELLDYLDETGGTAFYHEDDPALSDLVAKYPALKSFPYSTSTLMGSATFEGLSITWQRRAIHTKLTGEYNLSNLAAALAVGSYFAIAPDNAARVVADYEPDNNRSQRLRTGRNALILDAYNANPSSMRAALENLRKETLTDSLIGKSVILGDMLELGDYTAAAHHEVVDLLSGLSLNEAFLVGRHFTAAGGGAYLTFPDADALRSHLAKHPLHDRLILIKGSRGMHLEQLTDSL